MTSNDNKKKEGYTGFHNAATERFWMQKFPVIEWRAAVVECKTQLGYKEWLIEKMNQYNNQ